jgi:hypothetical protein
VRPHSLWHGGVAYASGRNDARESANQAKQEALAQACVGLAPGILTYQSIALIALFVLEAKVRILTRKCSAPGIISDRDSSDAY